MAGPRSSDFVMRTLKLIGYWVGTQGHEIYPHPRDFVRKDWDPELKAKVVGYLKGGAFKRGFWGHATCRFDPTRDPVEMGSKELTDGVYLWPEGLAVYVNEYDVGLPGEFMSHMERHNYQLPPDLGEGKAVIDLSFWKEWTRKSLDRLAKGEDLWTEDPVGE
jgi:hypothetical protein